MGKAYSDELALLPESYEWARNFDISSLRDALIRLGGLPLISIGSGGSLTAAYFHAKVHECATGRLSKPMTPLMAASLGYSALRSGVALLSAEGKNPDIRGVLRYIAKKEPPDLLAFCLKEAAPLIADVRENAVGAGVAFEMPWGKDGYLATNSLLATCCLIFRGYAGAFPGVLPTLPPSLEELLGSVAPNLSRSEEAIASLLLPSRAYTFLILHDADTQILAIDLESKLIESAMATVVMSDLRNFAHGRHLWAHANRENVIALFLSHGNSELCLQTKNLIPSDIPYIDINFCGDALSAQIAAIAVSIRLIGAIGLAKGIDPGSPPVPDFGRKLYTFDAFRSEDNGQKTIADMQLAVTRKLGASRAGDWEQSYAKHLRDAYSRVLEELSETRFSGVVLDYDSTLCTPEQRFEDLPEAVGRQLEQLIALGLDVGIATGRGKSVVTAVKNVVADSYWQKIWVGMYNGGLIARLDEGFCIDTIPQDEQLKQLELLISSDPYLGGVIKTDLRPTQLTVSVGHPSLSDHVWPLLLTIISRNEFRDLKVLRSLHSWDIINKSTSKCTVLKALSKDEVAGAKVLCIGDRGRWPGNDCELLRNAHSLGVDEVDVDANSAWNLAPPGVRGPAATLFYLRLLEKDGNLFRIRVQP